MTTTTPAPVLDYAPSPAPNKTARRVLRAVVILLCGLIQAFIADRFQPVRYVATAYMQVSPLMPVVSAQAVDTAQQQADATIRASIPTLTVRLPGVAPISPTIIVERLTVTPIPQSRLIQVRFEDESPFVAAAVANALINQSTSPTLSIIAPAAIPAKPLRRPIYPFVGFLLGCGVGVVIVLFDRHTRPRSYPVHVG